MQSRNMLLSVCFILFTNISLNAQSFKEDVLNRHNYWRAQVGVAPLKWSESLAQSAEKWANTLVRRNCDLQHSNSEYGENLWMGMGDYSTIEIVDDWASERKHYNITNNTCASGEICGHYTQIVWEKSTELGCATVQCKDGWTIVICQFNPAGNYIGERPFSTTTTFTAETQTDDETIERYSEVISRNLDKTKENRPTKNAETKSYLLELAKDYTSDAYKILTYDENDDITVWVTENTKKGAVESFSTVVHETLHGYDSKLSDFNSSGYFINKHIELIVPHQKKINSSKINSFIPKNKRQQLSRYELYIGDGSDMSSQIEGIYGIIEEFNGYYHGMKAIYDLKEANVPFANNEWISNELESFWEFQLFVAWYLQLCKAQYPDVYKATMGDMKLRIAYTLIHRNFSTLSEAIKNHPVISKSYSRDTENLFTNKDLELLNEFFLDDVNFNNYMEYYK